MIAKTPNVATVRCPACGQPLNPPDAARCPLCKQPLSVEDVRSTGEDITPYARAFAEGRSGWLEMCKWICTAGGQRLKHLAMIRASDASRRFALVSSLWFALGLTIVQGTRVGWHALRVAPDLPNTSRPVGQGWLKILAAGPTNTTELWWNPAQAMIAAVCGGLAGLAALLLWRALAAIGVSLAHPSEFRREQRMTAALHYSLAWGAPALLAALACILRPVTIYGDAARVSWTPPDVALLMLGGVLGAISATGWWIWLVRLGATAPPSASGRVTAFMLLVAPGLAIAGGAGWWYGWEWVEPKLFTLLNMRF